MAVLKNHQHELFVQQLASGKSAADAYMAAGYARHNTRPWQLLRRREVRERLDQILGAAANRAGIAAERILNEYARIAFADIGKVATWRTTIEEKVRKRYGRVITEKIKVVEFDVKDTADLDEDTRAAIAKVWKGPKDTVRVEFHDKRAALRDLARMIGLFREPDENDGDVTVNIIKYPDDIAKPPE
jgi:phage terminase small subunit